MTNLASIAAEIEALDYSHLRVLPEFIDGNGHMNVGYYGVLFDKALDLAWAHLGIGWDLIEREQKSSFTLESHFTYQQEVKEGDPLSFTVRVLDFDAKRIHTFMTMHHAEKKYLAATYEQLGICIDMRVRKSASWPAAALARISAVHAVHSQEPRRPEVGRGMAIRRG
jgi:acyl-CoA thioester hydrolase